MGAANGVVWANEWIEAIEDSGSFGEDVLKAGARLARNQSFVDVEVAPGLLSGRITHRGSTYTAQLGVQVLADDQWSAFCEQLLEQPAKAVALILGELPDGCVDVPLIPSAGELYPDCNCGDWNGVCVHATALLYEAARLIESDPFVLTTLRGRGRYELKSAIETARTESDGQRAGGRVSGHPRGEDPGMPAAAAYRRQPEELPTARRLPLDIGEPVALSVPPPVDSGVSVDDVHALVIAASKHAKNLLYLES